MKQANLLEVQSQELSTQSNRIAEQALGLERDSPQRLRQTEYIGQFAIEIQEWLSEVNNSYAIHIDAVDLIKEADRYHSKLTEIQKAGERIC